MKRSYASGHQKRVDKKRKEDASIANTKKLTSWFSSEQDTSIVPNKSADEIAGKQKLLSRSL